MDQDSACVYRFEDCVYDDSDSCLYRGAERVPLSRKSKATLDFLLRHPGVVVKKDDLKNAVWGAVNVVPNNVDRQISTLKALLRKRPGGGDYIETVYGQGYIFLAEVTRGVPSDLAVPPPPSASSLPLATPENLVQADEPPPNRKRPVLLLMSRGIAFALLIAIGLWSIRNLMSLAARIGSRGLQPYYVGIADLEAGDALQARLAFERAVKLEPRFAASHAGLSAALSVLGHESKAAEEAKTALDLSTDASHEDALWVRGQYYETKNEWQEAARAFEAASAMAPDDVEYAIKHALSLTKLGRQPEAFSIVEKLQREGSSSAGNPGLDLAEAQIAESASDYGRELRAAKVAEEKASAHGMYFVVGRAELLESWALDNLARLSEAESKATDAQTRLSQLKDYGGSGRAWKNLADVYIDQQKLEKAKDAYSKAIAQFHKIGWRSGEAVALNNLAYVYRDCGDLPGASDLFEQSLRISRSTGDLRRQAMALNGVAIVLKRRGNLKGAEEAYLADLEADNRLSNDGDSATVLNNLAIVLEDEGKTDEAEGKLQEALSIFKRLGRQIDVAMVDGNLGDLKIRVGDLAAAGKNYKLQADLGKKIPQPKQLAYGLFGLGEVAFLRCDLRAATTHLQESFDKRKATGDLGTAAESQLALAEVLLEEKRFAEAESKARESLGEFVKEHQEDQRAVALAVISEALVGKQNKPEALSAAGDAAKLAEISEDKDSQISVRLHIWKAIEANGRTAEAVEDLRSALKDAEASKYLPRMLEARAALAAIKFDSGDRSAEQELALIREQAAASGLLLIVEKASAARHEPVLALVHH